MRSTALKFRGSFSVQAKGDGAVPMLLADCTDTGALRGYARSDPKKLEELLRKDPSPAADRLLGGGYLYWRLRHRRLVRRLHTR